MKNITKGCITLLLVVLSTPFASAQLIPNQDDNMIAGHVKKLDANGNLLAYRVYRCGLMN